VKDKLFASEIGRKHWKNFDFEGCSFSGDIQDSPGQGPVQPAVGDPASAGGLDQKIPRGPFQPQPFCDPVILQQICQG